MTMTIALAGKGGTGKTTIAGMITYTLVKKRYGTVLAIDADPATNLNLVLGLPTPATVGEIREDMIEGIKDGSVGTGITRHDFLNTQVRLAIEEGDTVDLLAMGRPEGQGCYCAFNHILRQVVDGYGKSYDFVVIDNEAGMEHLSRRTTRDVDVLLVVTDPTVRGVKTAESIVKLADELQINVKQSLLLINRVQGELPPTLQKMLATMDLEFAGVIPADVGIGDYDAVGRPLIELSPESPAMKAVAALTEKLVRAHLAVTR